MLLPRVFYASVLSMAFNIRLGAAIGLMLCVSGCQSHVSVEPMTAGSATAMAGESSSPPTVEYSNYWEAMENLDFEYARRYAFEPDLISFSAGLEKVVKGQVNEAAQLLYPLARSSANKLVKDRSNAIMGSLYFNQPGSFKSFLASKGYKLTTDLAIRYPSSPVTLPIAFSHFGTPVVEVMVNGQKKFFWVDTGSGITAIASDKAASCGVSPLPIPAISVGTATHKNISAQPAVINSLSLGDIQLTNVPTMILNRSDLEFNHGVAINYGFGAYQEKVAVDGIIGWNLIQRFRMEIDYKRKLLTLSTPTPGGGPDRNFFWLGFPIIQLTTLEGRTLAFGLDTGAKESLITDNILKKIGDRKVTRQERSMTSLGGSQTYQAQSIEDLQLVLTGYKVTFHKITTGVSVPGAFIKLDGILGGDFAREGKIVIDATRGEFEFHQDSRD